MSPRWRKLMGDVRVARRRFIGIAIAMTMTIAAVAAVLTAKSVLDREMNRNYLNTIPPSAVISLDAIDPTLLEEIRRLPGVIAAERNRVIWVKTQFASGEPLVAALRVVPDFSAQRIAKFYPESGAWPPSAGEVLLERAVNRMLPSQIGEDFSFELASGESRSLRIAGTVHDPGNAPAWQERVVYGYINAETLAQLTGSVVFDELNIVTDVNTTPAIESSMRTLALWLRTKGHAVHFIRIPPPGRHPHQWQIDAMSLTLLGFGLLGIVLEAALLAVVIGGLLAPQVRQIAVMKAIGARTRQIVGMYSTLVVLLAAIALAIGMPLGILAGHELAEYVARLLNFDIADDAVPLWVMAACVALGILVPLCAALWPIISAARRSVRDSIDYVGVTSNTQNGWLLQICNRLRVGNVSLQLALRNVSRRKSQALLAMCLLVLTGTIFMVAGNLLSLWRSVTSASIAEQRYDIQVSLRQAEVEQAVKESILSVPGVKVVEPARRIWVNVDDGDTLSFSTRSMPLHGVPADSELRKFDMVEGRWLRNEGENEIVLNSSARANVFPKIAVGDVVSLIVKEKSVRFTVVGIARELFDDVQSYTTDRTFAKVVEPDATIRNVLVGLQPEVDADATARTIETTLSERNLPARGVFTKASLVMGITMHTYIFVAMMLLIVVAVAKIAVAGLASCMSTAVIERTREFGIMRTVGARSYDIQNSIIFEALLIGAASWMLAIICAIPLTLLAGDLIGTALNRSIPVVFSLTVALLWALGVALVAVLASVAPAKRAATLTIRNAIEHT